MHILFNALALSSQKTGGGVYMVNLLRAMSALEGDHRLSILTNCETAVHFRGLSGSGVELIDCGRATVRRPLRLLWEQTRMLRLIEEIDPDIFHAPGFVLPLKVEKPSVLTIFDMTFFSHPTEHQWSKRLYFTSMIPPSIARADRLIAISQSTAGEIRRWLSVPEEKIRVICLAAGDRFGPEAAGGIEEMRRLLALPERYILSVATLEPRKNLPMLLKAYKRLPSGLRREYPLVLAGKPGWGRQDVRRLAEDMGLGREVIFAGYVDDDLLPSLYAGAGLFVYPSLYEGFGLPVLEAMACGTPVLTSNLSSMPEVAGEAALLADPGDAGDLAGKMALLLGDKALSREMSARGAARAASFSWESTARRTLSVYEELSR